MSTVGEIYKVLDQWASFSTAESFDNSGLLIGGMEQPVSFCLLALDLTQAVCEEAAERGGTTGDYPPSGNLRPLAAGGCGKRRL